MSTASLLDIINAKLDAMKAQLDRMEQLRKRDRDEDHAILLEIEDAVTADPAVTLDVTAGPPEEQP